MENPLQITALTSIALQIRINKSSGMVDKDNSISDSARLATNMFIADLMVVFLCTIMKATVFPVKLMVSVHIRINTNTTRASTVNVFSTFENFRCVEKSTSKAGSKVGVFKELFVWKLVINSPMVLFWVDY